MHNMKLGSEKSGILISESPQVRRSNLPPALKSVQQYNDQMQDLVFILFTSACHFGQKTGEVIPHKIKKGCKARKQQKKSSFR